MIAAAWTGKKDVIRYLLKNGANVNQHDKFRWTALIAAVNGGHRETVEFLISNGADINAVGEDGSALRRAIEKNNAEMVNLLLKHGAIDRYGFQAVNSK